MSVFDVSENLPQEPSWEYYVARHLHFTQKVAPNGAAPVTLTAGAAWVLGDVSADILAADVETNTFDTHFAVFSGPSANGTYVVELYAGAGDTLIATTGFTRTAVFTNSVSVLCQSRMIVGSSRLRAKVKSDQAGATVEMMVYYHSY